MDKQKQIEEMARIIAFELCPNRAIHKKWGEEAQCYSDNNFAECKEIKNVVDKLYNAGYRKESETAEKFARLVEFHSVSTRDNNGREIFTISALCLKEILHEEFGIPYDEIAKEIAEG